jgi:hypothetical protein
MRLGQRLSGGVGAALERISLRVTDETVDLAVPRNQGALIAEPVWRRLERLAASLGRLPRSVVEN